jgi:hypothetical protein
MTEQVHFAELRITTANAQRNAGRKFKVHGCSPAAGDYLTTLIVEYTDIEADKNPNNYEYKSLRMALNDSTLSALRLDGWEIERVYIDPDSEPAYILRRPRNYTSATWRSEMSVMREDMTSNAKS